MGKMISTNQQIDVAIAICNVLGIGTSSDENLWRVLEHVDVESICEELEEDIFNDKHN